MKIENKENNDKGTFYIKEGNDEVALLTYKARPDGTMVIDHTEVDEKLRNQGIGGDLVREAVNYARRNSRKIVPQCPFAKAEFDENESYKDVLK